MKLVLVVCILAAASSAAPQQSNVAQILSFENENLGPEGYKFSFETSDPIKRSESGEFKNPGSEQETINVRGEYSFKLPDGKTHTVTFVADENGYQPKTQTN